MHRMKNVLNNSVLAYDSVYQTFYEVLWIFYNRSCIKMHIFEKQESVSVDKLIFYTFF